MNADAIQWLLTIVIFPALAGMFWMTRSMAADLWQSLNCVKVILQSLKFM